MRNSVLLVAVCLLIIFSVGDALAGMVTGKVSDMYTGEPIPGAKVLVEGTTITTITGKDGSFTLPELSPGSYRISCGANSYNKQTKSVQVGASATTVNFILEIGAEIVGEEVLVEEEKPVVDTSPQTSSHQFKAEEIQDNAGAFEDVSKVMKKLPGVVQSTSFTADMYVRGAQNWENLILIDDFLLLNPYHFGAALSIINSDLVDEVTFYAGGFPAKYPFATGSVLDVTYKDAPKDKVEGLLSVSMLSAHGYVAGPIKEQFGWTFTFRRSYYDYLIDLLDYQDVPVPIFSELMARLTWEPNSSNRFLVMLNRNEDSLRLKINEENATSVDEGDAAYTGLTQVYGLNWELVPIHWFLMKNSITHQIINLDANLTSETPLFAQSQINATYFHNELDFQVHPRNLLIMGGDVGYVTVDLDARIRVSDWILGSNTQSDLNYFDTDFEHNAPVELFGGYIQDEWEVVKDKFRINVGARFDYFSSDGQGWMNSPRASAAWTIVPKTVLKGSWGIYYFPPFNILATDEELGNPDLRPQRAHHHVLGLEQGIGDHGMLRVEAFYIMFEDLQFQKWEQSGSDLENLVAAVNGESVLPDITWENSGYGKSYGLELFAQKKLSGKWDGWIAYTLSEVLYNDGMDLGWFHPYQDQRHTLNIVGNYRPFPEWVFSATFGLYSGKPVTPIRSWEKSFPGTLFQYWSPEQGAVNSDTLPVYHQLDVRIERIWKLSNRVNLTGFLEVYNVYNQRNVFDYWYAEDTGLDKPVRKTIYDLPILPFVGAKVDF